MSTNIKARSSIIPIDYKVSWTYYEKSPFIDITKNKKIVDIDNAKLNTSIKDNKSINSINSTNKNNIAINDIDIVVSKYVFII